MPTRVKQVWPNVDPTTQPFLVTVPGGQLLEMPIAAITDYATVAEIVSVFEAAQARLRKDPHRDVFVVLGFHLETAADFAGRLADAMTTVRGRTDLAADLSYVTMEQAAELARGSLAPAPGT